MIPIVEVPKFVHSYANGYKDLFSPALFDHFERYLSGLYVCERRNAQLINNAFVIEVKDQSSLNRFLTEYQWSTKQFNERRLVDWALAHGFTQPFVFDSWYTCQELCHYITSNERDW